MTLTPYDIPVEPRHELAGMEPALVCANPRCNKPADHRHHIERRSATGGPADWIEIPSRSLLVANVCGLCAVDHSRVTGEIGGHKAMILWDDESSQLVWADLEAQWAEPLSPAPPVFPVEPESVNEPIRRFAEPEPEQEYDITEGQTVEGPPQMPRLLAELVKPAPGPAEEPIVRESDETWTLSQRIQATDRYLAQIEQGIPSVDESGEPVLRVPLEAEIERAQETAELEITSIDSVVDESTSPLAVEIARARTETMERAAAESVELAPPPLWFKGTIAIDPGTLATMMLAGDQRVKELVDEKILASRPKPKRERIKSGEPSDIPRRNWTISVPAEERSEEKGRLGEDGHALLDAVLEQAAELMPHREPEGSGWKYYVLADALNWFVLNFDPTEED